MMILNGPSIPLLVLIDTMQCSGASCDEDFTCSLPFGCDEYGQYSTVD